MPVEARETSRGGRREGAGRKPSGRVQYVTRLRPDLIARLREEAQRTGKAECEIVEAALSQLMVPPLHL
jgi:hypothetical protein